MATNTERKNDIKKLLKESTPALVKALMILYRRQTDDERSAQTTTHDNGQGFTAFDAHILTSFATQYEAKQWLSAKQLNVVRKLLGKYSTQLLPHYDELFAAAKVAEPKELPPMILSPERRASMKEALFPKDPWEV